MTTEGPKYRYECEHGIKGDHPFDHLIGPQTLGTNATVEMGYVCHPERVS